MHILNISQPICIIKCHPQTKQELNISVSYTSSDFFCGEIKETGPNFIKLRMLNFKKLGNLSFSAVRL